MEVDLIDDIWQQVFNNFGVDRARLATVCKRWSAIILNPRHWRTFEADLNGRSTRRGFQRKEDRTISIIDGITSFISKYCTGLTDCHLTLDYEENKGFDLLNVLLRLKSLKRLHFNIVNSGFGTRAIEVAGNQLVLPQCKDLVLLNLMNVKVTNPEDLQRLLCGLPNIEELYLDQDLPPVEVIAPAQKLKLLSVTNDISSNQSTLQKLSYFVPSLRYLLYCVKRAFGTTPFSDVSTVGNMMVIPETALELLRMNLEKCKSLGSFASPSLKPLLLIRALQNRCSKEVVQYLVNERKYDVNYTYSGKYLYMEKNSRGIFNQMAGYPLYAALDDVLVKSSFDAQKDPADAEVVEELLKLGANPNSPLFSDSPLHHCQDAVTFMMLIKYGANPNKLVNGYPVAWSPLFYEKFVDPEIALKGIINMIDINAVYNKQSILSIAINNRLHAVPLVKILMEAGVQWNSHSMNELFTKLPHLAYELAASQKVDLRMLDTSVVFECLEKGMLDVFRDHLKTLTADKDEPNLSPMHYAAVLCTGEEIFSNDRAERIKENKPTKVIRHIGKRVDKPSVTKSSSFGATSATNSTATFGSPTLSSGSNQPSDERRKFLDALFGGNAPNSEPNTSPFGAKPTTSSFNASLFGSTPSSSSSTGSTPNAGLFGTKPSPFGTQPTTTSFNASPFGVTPSSFGSTVSPANSGTFGSTNTVTNSSPFGTTASTTNSSVVRNASPFGSNAVNNASPFGSASNSGTFGSRPTTTSIFNASPFGVTPSSFGSTVSPANSSTFGSKPTTSSFGGFGSESHSNDDNEGSLRISKADSGDNEKDTMKSLDSIDEVIPLLNCSINETTSDGTTPLLLLCKWMTSYEGKLRGAASLINHGANVNLADKRGCTPLHAALYVGDWKLASLLLEHGANINAQDGKGITPLMALIYGFRHIPQLQKESNEHFEAEWSKLMTLCDVDLTLVDRSFNRSLVHLMASIGCPSMFECAEQKLLKTELINARDIEGFTPLHYAVMFDNIEMVRYLLDHGADANAQTVSLKITPAMLLAMRYNKRTSYLKYYNLLLLAQCICSHLPTNARKILVEPPWLRSKEGSSIWAGKIESFDNMMQLLNLFLSRSNMTLVDDDGNTILHHLVKLIDRNEFDEAHDMIELIRTNVSFKTYWTTKNHKNQTAANLLIREMCSIATDNFILASQLERDIMQLIREHEIDFANEDLLTLLLKSSLPSSFKRALLTQLDLSRVQYLDQQITEWRAGPLFNLLESPIYDAELVKAVLDAYPNSINETNRDGATPLIYHVIQAVRSPTLPKGDKFALIDVLLAAPGVDLNAQDQHGNTALHYACKHFHTGIIDAIDANFVIAECEAAAVHCLFAFKLVEAGARTDVENKRGQTPLDLTPKLMQHYQEVYPIVKSKLQEIALNAGKKKTRSKKIGSLLSFV